MNNLFDHLPNADSNEIVEILAESNSIRIERIVSSGQSSPEGFWYDQDENEWVVVLKGHAELLIEGEAQPISMKPGDYQYIAAHRRHRVESTSSTEPTVWLAVFF